MSATHGEGSAKSDDEIIGGQMALQRFQAALLGVFALIGLIVAALGVYGVVNYLVTLRTHEVGVRMALGASSGHILRAIVQRALLPIAVSYGVGLIATLASARLIRASLFGVTPHDPLTLALASCLLLAIAVAASYVPARRATRVNPVEALRAE